MKICFVSVLSSNRIISELHRNSGLNPGFAIQKFDRLFAKGLQDNGADVTVLSALPVNRQISSKLFWLAPVEKEDNLVYHYLPFINIPILRQLCLVITSFFKVLLWTMFNPKQKAVICDVLNTSICMATVLACKLSRTQVVGFVTDMPGMMVGTDALGKISLISRLTTCFTKLYLASFDKYVFLTKAANDVINIYQRPYIIMEGISDPEMASFERNRRHSDVRTIMYAGGVYARYGLDTLVKAFIQLDSQTCKLVIYGSGAFVNELEEYYCAKYPNIKYMGVALTSDIIKAELKADLLINPRPTKEDFTKYSFPSKNIEYMASGTPLVTTKLPGMPEEYYDYVFLLEDETVEGYADTLRSVLRYTDEELFEYGAKAKQYILNNKNVKIQGERIIKLLAC